MGQTRGVIKSIVRTNLNDNGITFWSDSDLNDSIQDAYDDIVCLSQCIPKTATFKWIGQLTYYDAIQDLGLTDYLSTVAIFNYSTNLWLRDDLNLRDLDRLRRDWECWIGTPQFWVSTSPRHFAIAPKYPTQRSNGAFSAPAFSEAFYIGSNSLNSFKILYWATAPILTGDSSTLLTASDVQNMFEFYVTADMLEQAQEFSKAAEFWGKYYDSLTEYSQRVKANNKSDLLLRV